MLVLSRRVNEAVVVDTADGLMRVVLLEIRGDRVRLGFDADERTRIHREEIWVRIQNEERGGNAKGK